MKEKIVLNKKKFLDIIYNFNSIQTFEITELKGIPILKIKPASLNDQIKAQELLSVFIKKEDLKNLFHPKALFEIEIFHKCVIDPIFTIEEIVKISEVYPELINKVCTFALGIKPNFDSLEE